MANNQPNVNQLSTLLKDDPAILQAGIGSVISSISNPQPSTAQIQQWYTNLMANQSSPTPPKVPKIDIDQLSHTENSSQGNINNESDELISGCHDSPTSKTTEDNEKSHDTGDNSKDFVDCLAELPFADEISDGEAKVPEKLEQKVKSAKKKRNNDKMRRANQSENSRKRPNHFVAFPIRSQQIHDNVKKVQDNVVAQNKAFESSLISLPTLHITMLVMNIDESDSHSITRAEETLDRCRQHLPPELRQGLNLKFEGLGHFPSGVLFGKVAEGEALDKLRRIASVVRDTFTKDGFELSEQRFEAHLTILKLSKVAFHIKKKCGKVSTALYEENKNLILGHEKMSSLQLLSMNKPKDKDGYYYCLKTITLETKEEDEDKDSK